MSVSVTSACLLDVCNGQQQVEMVECYGMYLTLRSVRYVIPLSWLRLCAVQAHCLPLIWDHPCLEVWSLSTKDEKTK